MGNKLESKGCSVKIEPLKKGRFFDIQNPKNGSPIDAESGEQAKGFRSFFWMAFILFVGFAALGTYGSSKSFIFDTKNTAMAGYDSLMSGVSSLSDQNFEKAEKWFEGAEMSFKEIDQNMRFLNTQANNYLKTGLYLDAAQKLIDSGVSVSKIGRQLANLLNDTKAIPATFIQQNTTDDTVRLTDMVQAQKKRVDELLMEALLLEKNLTGMNVAALPKPLTEQIVKAQWRIGQFLTALKEVESNFKTVLTLLGDKIPHRYLVLLQNNHELRATGGFLGSYMLMDVNDGKITKIETKDIYQTDGQLADVVTPPPGINKVAERLYMRDANYSPDFPTSAKQLMWFLEHSRGPSVDTVIAIDQTVAEKLLALTGPVVVPSFPFAIRADNFNDLLSYHIESKLSETTTPKQLLIDLIPIFKEKLFSLGQFSTVSDLGLSLIAGRHVQLYSNDPDVQALAQRFKMDGAMVKAQPDVDYLAVVTTAIGGNKSDAFIKTDLTHHTKVNNLGQITDELTIKKTHTWQEKDFAYWKKLIDRYGAGKLSEQTLKFIQGQGDNVDYMRVYVPKGSRLITLEGVDIEDLTATEENGYTIFAFTFGPVSAGHQQTVHLNYVLPYQVSTDKPLDMYRFIAQKQAGAENIALTKSLQTSDYLQVVETYPKIEQSAFTLYPEYKTAFDQNQIFLSAIRGN